MDAYFIDAGEVGDAMEGYARLVDIVVAPTRGRAKYLFWQHYRWDLDDLTTGWCERMRLIQRGVDCLPEGVLGNCFSEAYRLLWERAMDKVPA